MKESLKITYYNHINLNKTINKYIYIYYTYKHLNSFKWSINKCIN